MNKKICIICDIDGVYTDSREWGKHIPKKRDDREGWDKFATYITLCKPNKNIIKILSLINKFIPILFVTSREDVPPIKNETIKQIESFSNNKILLNNNSKNILFMRKKNDYREAHIVKKDILELEILPYYYPILAIDDEKENINIFRSKKIFSVLYTKLRK